jgi:hypothetical protein
MTEKLESVLDKVYSIANPVNSSRVEQSLQKARMRFRSCSYEQPDFSTFYFIIRAPDDFLAYCIFYYP